MLHPVDISDKLVTGMLKMKFESKDVVGNVGTSMEYELRIDGTAPTFNSFGPTSWVGSNAVASIYVADFPSGAPSLVVGDVNYWVYTSLGWSSASVGVTSYSGGVAEVTGLEEGMP